jgi:hypothetical protein
MTSHIIVRKYPTSRSEYCKRVARVREEQIARIFEELGFKVKKNFDSRSSPDLKLYFREGNRDKLISLVEITNENKGSFYCSKEVNGMAKKLSKYKRQNLLRILICSFESSLKEKSPLLNHYIIELGFQTLPKDYYEFYQKRGEIQFRKEESEAYPLTKEVIEREIHKIFRREP